MTATNLNNSRRNLTLYPLLYLAIFFASGVFFASLVLLEWEIYLSATLAFACVSIVFFNKYYTVVFVLAAFFCAGSFSYQVYVGDLPEDSIKAIYDSNQINSGDPIEIEGTVNGKPELAVGGFFLLLNAEKAIYKSHERNLSGTIRLFAHAKTRSIETEFVRLDLRHGRRIRIAVNLKREDIFFNPGSVSYKKILDQKGIHATGLIKSPLLIERLEGESVGGVFAYVFEYRQDLIKSVRKNFNVSTSGILIASMFGNRHHLTKDTAEIFRDGGTFHVLVISGLHITFIGGVLLLFVRIFTRNKWLHFLITAAALWGYALAVGAGIPVVRAALMFSVLLFSLVIYRKGTLLNALGACALVILLWRPGDLFSQSFHLTFVSLTGIISVGFPLIEKLRAIGNWSPSAKTPFPPKVPRSLKTFCETLFWSEKKWQKTRSENVWDCEVFKSPYAKWLEKYGIQKPIRWAFEGGLVTAIVQLFLLPFLIVYFHRLSFASILLNLWVGIFVVLQNIVAIIAILSAKISVILALPLIKLTEVFNWILLFLPKLFIENDFSAIRVPIYSDKTGAIYILYFIPLIFLAFILNYWNPFAYKKKKHRFLTGKIFVSSSLLILFAFMLLIGFHPYSAPTIDGKLTFDFLDVGQGDSILVTFPNGKIMLIDGGGRRFDKQIIERNNDEFEEFEPDIQRIGETVVSEFLWEKGYSKVDYILATHADADHAQGLIDVAKNFDVELAFIGENAVNDKDYAGFFSILRRRNITKKTLVIGDNFEIGGVKIEVLNPSLDQTSAQNSANNNSLVLSLSFGVKRFLLTGDIEKRAEKFLLKESGRLKADVVKAAHHGSQTSSTIEFVKATGAEFAIVTVGRNSPFGHPHKEVVERWKLMGAKVLTTGENGTITVSTDGKNIEIQTFLKGE